MNKDYTTLNADQQRRLHDAMEKQESLEKITREASVSKVILCLLEDKPSLERYLRHMAGQLTKERRQISYQALITSIFHIKKVRNLSLLNDVFLMMVTDVIDRERETQKRTFILENHLQASIQNDQWRMYERHGDVLRLKNLDFTSIHCASLRYEMKYYLRHMFECKGKVSVPLFDCQYMALNTLTKINPKIRYFTDISEADARAMLLFLERSYKKKDGTPLSQYYTA